MVLAGRHRHSVALAVFGLGCVVVISACGGGGAGQGPSAAPLLKLAECMRAHGVPNFPDPSSQGGIHLAPGSGLDPRSPSFQAAQKVCAKYGPKGGALHMTEAQREAAVKFAQCVRSHGDPEFPDPVLTPPKGAASVLVLRGMVFAFSTAFNPQSPAFRQAAAHCGLHLPTFGHVNFQGK